MKAFYLIDKPQGYTSFDVLRDLRKKLQIKKMWHTGTLDPLATGALLVAIWEYTKLIPYFEKDIKEYVATIALNGISPSCDSETPVEYLSEQRQKELQKSLKKQDIEKILCENFSGTIDQIPPKYSALKIWWKKALDIVRAWGDVEMKSRKVTMYESEVLDFEYPYVKCRFKVSAGTYIRSLAFDIWQFLWAWGYLTQLRRTCIWKLSLEQAQSLDTFKKEQVLDVHELFGDEKIIVLDEKIVERMNLWLETMYPSFWREDGKYFVEKSWKITNIVSYQKPLLKAKKRIF